MSNPTYAAQISTIRGVKSVRELNDAEILADIREVLSSEGFSTQRSMWKHILTITSGSTMWRLYVEVVRRSESIAVVFSAVSDDWAEDESSADLIEQELCFAAEAYAAHTGLTVSQAPVARWY